METESNKFISLINSFNENFPSVGSLTTTLFRWVFVILALFILTRALFSLLKAKNPSEIWAYVQDQNGNTIPITHWENVIGRAGSCDIALDDPSVSRNHATLMRNRNGTWSVRDLRSKNGTYINGHKTVRTSPAKADIGDVIAVGNSRLTIFPVSLEEQKNNTTYRLEVGKPVSPWASLIALSIFQILTVVQLIIALGDKCTASIPISFIGLTITMWVYFILLRSMKRTGFEMETIAFFLSTLSLAITASTIPEAVFKQFIAIVLGLILFFCLCWYLRDLTRTKKIRMILVGAAVLLLLINVIFGETQYGAKNWVSIAGMTIQPSELVKVCFIYAGAATLDELFEKKNLTFFMLLSGFCLGCLALMGDFGTAAIFFVTFLIISFLRSGDFSKLILISGVAVAGGLLVLRFRPVIASRFASWGHVWEVADAGGFQQTRTMCAASSGGLVGVGAGNGWLHNVFAADKDLVFGMLCEEWGLIIAAFAVFSIVTFSIFAVRSIMAGRSTFYTIAACSAMSMLLFQTILNVLGSVDLLPLTGVTFPFVSNGGTSMMVSWGLLAFLKTADTRQNASFAVKATKKGELEGGSAL